MAEATPRTANATTIRGRAWQKPRREQQTRIKRQAGRYIPGISLRTRRRARTFPKAEAETATTRHQKGLGLAEGARASIAIEVEVVEKQSQNYVPGHSEVWPWAEASSKSSKY